MNHLTADDLPTIAHFYCNSLNMRLAWGHIPEAVDSGYTAKRLTTKLHDNDMRISMLPVLAQGLLMSNRVIDCVDILKELDYTRSQTHDQSAQAWYYACCLDIILETGFQLEHYQQCIGFATEMRQKPAAQCSQGVRYYTNCCLALWFMRKKKKEQMHTYHEVALKDAPTELENYMDVRGFTKLIEIKLIMLSRKLANNNKAHKQGQGALLEANIKDDFKYLSAGCKRLPVIKPRLLHLEAYHHAIHGRQKKASRLLDRSMVLAEEMGCTLETHWVQHSRLAWFDRQFDQTQSSFWMDHCDEEMLDWHLGEQVDLSLIMYTLPLPYLE